MQPSTHPRGQTGLPPSPRATRPSLPPLETTLSTPSSSTTTLASEQTQQTHQQTASDSTYPNPPPPYIRAHRSASSLIFINATIPLSPASSSSDLSSHDGLMDGLTPRKRSGFVRLFCCFGREERARRRVLRETGFEKVGGGGHWSEY